MLAFEVPLDLSTVTVERLLLASSSWEVQLVLAALHAIFWHVVLHYVLPYPIRRRVMSLGSLEQVVKYTAGFIKKFLYPDVKMPEDRDFVVDFVVEIYGVLLQHLCGGLLCVPAVLGVGPPSLRAALACHGALCEVGYEIQDSLVRIKERVFDGEHGRKKNPNSTLISLAMHHTAALCMVLPMNVYYRENQYYQESVFLLQGAAAIAYLCQQYGFTLNAAIRSEMMQLKASVTFTFITMLWSRGFRGLYVWYTLLCTFLADGRITVFRVALVPMVLMSVFNLLLIRDAVQKFQKLVLQKPLPPAVDQVMRPEKVRTTCVAKLASVLLDRKRTLNKAA
jgi:hypothetical protein